MKQLIGHDQGSYTFNPTLGTVTLTGIPILGDEQVLLVLNANQNLMMYNFADPTLNNLSFINNVITFSTTVTAGMNATDPLQIYVDIPTTVVTDTAAMQDSYTHLLLQRICDLLEPMATQDGNQRQRITLDNIAAGLTLGTVSTVSSLTGGTITTITNPVPLGNLATIGSNDPRYWFQDVARTAYGNNIRTNLSFTN